MEDKFYAHPMEKKDGDWVVYGENYCTVLCHIYVLLSKVGGPQNGHTNNFLDFGPFDLGTQNFFALRI